MTAAICVKAAAALDPRTAAHPRHIQDTAFLLACVEDLRSAQDALTDPDRANLRLLADRLNDRADAAWTALSGDDHDRALAAYRFLTR